MTKIVKISIQELSVQVGNGNTDPLNDLIIVSKFMMYSSVIVILHIVVKDTLSACCIRIKRISLTDHNQRSNHYFSFRDNFHSPCLLLSKLEAFSQMLLQEETEFKLLNYGRTRNVYRNNYLMCVTKLLRV